MDFEGRPRPGPKPVLTPLIDVVFLLLIFFLLTGTFAPPDPFSVQPPAIDSEPGAVDGPVMILIAADGRIAVDNRIVSETELETILVQRLQAGSFGNSITVKADTTTPTGIILRVLALTRRGGAPSVRLITVPGDAVE